jgi:ABC-type branched-subunit amino acid transport system ATPase component
MKPAELHLTRFRAFQDCSIPLSDVTVLAGPNNCGKTSVLWAIKTFFQFVGHHVSVAGDTQLSFHKHYVHAIDFMPIPKDDELWYNRDDRQRRPVKIAVAFDNQWECSVVFTARFGQIHVSWESKDLPAQTSAAGVKAALEREVVLISGLVGVLAHEPYVSAARRKSLAAEGRYPEVFRSTLLQMYRKSKRSLKTLNDVLSRFFGVELKTPVFDSAHDEYVLVEYTQSGQDYDVVAAGAGLQQVVQTLTNLYLARPQMILIDEPDAHLHPSLQSAVAGALESIAKEVGAQLVIATHSYDMIDYYPLANVIIVEASRQSCGPLKSNQEKQDKLAQVGIIAHSELIRLFSARFRTVVVEDDDVTILRGLDRALKTGLFGTCSVRSARGVGNFGIQKEVLDAVNALLPGTVSPSFLQDRDGLPDKWITDIQAKARQEGLDLRFLPRHEIENFMLDPGILRKALAAKQVDASRAQCQKMLLEAAAKTKSEFRQNVRETAKHLNHILGSSAGRQKLSAVEVENEMDDWVDSLPNDEKAVLTHYPGKCLLKEVRKAVQCQFSCNLSAEELTSVVDRRVCDRQLVRLLADIASAPASQ